MQLIYFYCYQICFNYMQDESVEVLKKEYTNKNESTL